MFDQHYKADPDHAIAFRKSLLSGDKDFKKHMAKPYVPDLPVKEMTLQQQSQLKKDTQKFIDLTDTVKQVSVLNNPQMSKKIFAELESIAKDWSHRPEFLDRIKTSQNSTALRLAQDYVKEHTNVKQQTQSYGLEI